MRDYRLLEVFRFRQPTRQFFYYYIALNWAISCISGLLGFMSDTDLYSWTNYTANTFGMTIGHAAGFMLLPVIVYSGANASSIKKGQGGANGWWLITPTVFVYFLGILGLFSAE